MFLFLFKKKGKKRIKGKKKEKRKKKGKKEKKRKKRKKKVQKVSFPYMPNWLKSDKTGTGKILSPAAAL